VDAHFILGMAYREIAQAEGVDKSAVLFEVPPFCVSLPTKNAKEENTLIPIRGHLTVPLL